MKEDERSADPGSTGLDPFLLPLILPFERLVG